MKVYLKIIIALLVISCSKEPDCCIQPYNCVLKFKNGKEDLQNHMFVSLNDEKNAILGIPDKSFIRKPIFDIYKGYYLELPNLGINTAYLSITIDEYDLVKDTLQIETMQKLIIEKDPYLEFYYDESDYLHNNCDSCLMSIDTATFHRLIDNHELEEFLVRIK